ncbi:C40 family peptidase [Inhella sp.]|uniref:C40 family peptidase n=1 Tax=Inhella sp. TaxID=1921806 RepID=UPI0035B2CBDA
MPARLSLPSLVLALLLSTSAAQAGPKQGPPHPDAAQPAAASASQAEGNALERFLQERGWTGPVAEGDGSLEEDWLTPVRDGAKRMVHAAMGFLGVPYVRGGNDVEQGLDCSGFTRLMFERTLGLVLPRRAEEQARLSTLVTIPRDQLKPGDLVFFNTMRRTFSHVGIYVGEGKFIHAPRAGAVVRVEDMRAAYWSKRFTGARRAPTASP